MLSDVPEICAVAVVILVLCVWFMLFSPSKCHNCKKSAMLKMDLYVDCDYHFQAWLCNDTEHESDQHS